MNLPSIFIDTHTHLYLPEFDRDRDAVIETALQRGVQKMLLPNIDSSTIGPMNDLASKFPGVCYPMMGLHPTSVKEDYREELDRVEHELAEGAYFGVGETGIDLYWDKSHLQEQRLAFIRQIELAIHYDLPIIIHARESFHEILEIVEQFKGRGLKGIFHAFTGTVEIARQVTSLGFLLGIGGIVTYRNSSLPDIVREIELTRLVLETDSPYLTPVPFRGKRNESSYIPYIAGAVQAIKNIPLEEVARITTGNVIRLFSLDPYD